MKRILLQYHIWEREYIILEILKKRLEKYNAVVGFADFMDIHKCLKFHPDVIVTHTVRTNLDSTVLSIMKLATGAVMIPMTVEGYYDLDNQDNVIKTIGMDKCPIDLIDYYIMWGEKNKYFEGKELLGLHKISSMDKIRVFGYIPYEKKAVLEYAKNDKYYDKYACWKNGYNRIIAFVTGFHSADYSLKDIYEEKSFVHNKGSEAHDKEIYNKEMSIKSMRTYREKYINDILQLSYDCPEIGIVVKMHPVEIDLMKKEGLDHYKCFRKQKNILLVESPFPIAAILEDAELLVHYGSTVSLETYIYGKPSLLRSDKYYINNNKNKSLIYTDKVDIDDYPLLLRKILNGISFKKDDKAETILLDCFNWKSDESYCPSAKIAEFLTSDLYLKKLKIDRLIKDGFISEDSRFMSSVRVKILIQLFNGLFHLDFKKVKCYYKYALNLTVKNILYTFFFDLATIIRGRLQLH